jgi:hypothetical protein
MKLYIFKSEANGGLYAFAGDEAGSNLPAGFARPGIRKAPLRWVFHRRTIFLGSESKVRSKCMAFNCGALNGRSWLLPKSETHLPNVADGLTGNGRARKGNPRPANRRGPQP